MARVVGKSLEDNKINSLLCFGISIIISGPSDVSVPCILLFNYDTRCCKWLRRMAGESVCSKYEDVHLDLELVEGMRDSNKT